MRVDCSRVQIRDGNGFALLVPCCIFCQEQGRSYVRRWMAHYSQVVVPSYERGVPLLRSIRLYIAVMMSQFARGWCLAEYHNHGHAPAM